ncbi:hypothetical protein F5X68DRAFT_203356 [Plectosphaerella plurivora]|uniref:Uncharacterized protein n=1 Tax=Plectosphaerella plurivora TaxID=936078 RepID=A0A9P9AE32_9PEZI|nr:hypothetical protein F5X68DRAFT_203356 [Plectosphaerella plurivora]
MSQAQFAGKTLFLASAFLNALSVPGHIKYGIEHLNPALRTIKHLPDHVAGHESAIVGWDYMNASFLIAGILNYHWSTTSGPRRPYEVAILWTLLLSGGTVGVRFWNLSSFKPLLSLWLAPVLSLAGWVLSR